MNKINASANDAVRWEPNTSIKGREEQFILKDVSCDQILKSWRYSLFSHEWLDQDGAVLNIQQMNTQERQKRQDITEKINTGDVLQYPVLGLGLSDNVEIGSGRAVFLTLAANGYKNLPVHLPKSCLEEFQDYLA